MKTIGLEIVAHQRGEILFVNGMRIDTQRIADGIYEMICQREEEPLVAFGMIPLWVDTALRKLIREKVISEYAKQIQCTPEAISEFVDEELIKQTIEPIIKAVCIGIYKAAKNAGKMIV